MAEFGEGGVSVELDQKPKVLWRAFTIDPNGLSVELLSRPLVPGSSAEDDPSRMGDGNERGVYMSTNRRMVEAAYAHTSLGLAIDAPTFNDRGSIVQRVTLPQCGLVVRVNTDGLPIRKPVIIPKLQGHYNNGFEGDEWIADQVPPENYRLVALILSRWANDSERLKIEIEESSLEQVGSAMKRIRGEFQEWENTARRFVVLIESLTPQQRMNEWMVNKIREGLSGKKV
jgi:hypothetical protein